MPLLPEIRAARNALIAQEYQSLKTFTEPPEGRFTVLTSDVITQKINAAQALKNDNIKLDKQLTWILVISIVVAVVGVVLIVLGCIFLTTPGLVGATISGALGVTGTFLGIVNNYSRNISAKLERQRDEFAQILNDIGQSYLSQLRNKLALIPVPLDPQPVPEGQLYDLRMSPDYVALYRKEKLITIARYVFNPNLDEMADNLTPIIIRTHHDNYGPADTKRKIESLEELIKHALRT